MGKRNPKREYFVEIDIDMWLFSVLALLGAIIPMYYCGEISNGLEIHHSVSFTSKEAAEYCKFTKKQLASSNNINARALCQEYSSEGCFVSDGNMAIILDKDG